MTTKTLVTPIVPTSRPLALRPWEARWLAGLGEGEGAVLWRPVAVPSWADEVEPKAIGGAVAWVVVRGRHPKSGGCAKAILCPLGRPGDLLWCKETWSPDHAAFYPHHPVVYRTDGIPFDWEIEGGSVESPEGDYQWFPFRWRSSTSMPRWASRTTLEVAAVEVRRVGELTEDEARAAGCDGRCPVGYIPAYEAGPLAYHFAYRWEEDFAKAGHPWSSNPWAWRVAVVKRGHGS